MRSVVVLLAWVAVAHADGDEIPRADKLFVAAQKLKDAGKGAEACAKFEESLKYNRNALGTMLNVALCDEQAGKLASAVKMFSDARDMAIEHKLPEYLQAAEEHLAKDEPLVAHLAIAFTEPPGPDTKVLVDNDVVATSSAADVPVDVGSHVVTVTAPGRVPNETKLDIAARQHKAIVIPKLAFPVTARSSRSTIGEVMVIGGAGIVATSVVLGLVARSNYRGQFKPDATGMAPCTGTGSAAMCDPAGYSKLQSARTLGNVATVVGIGGIAAIGVGTYLWLRSGESHAPLAVVPVVTPDRAGLAAVGRF